jgi:hypothetical protein
LKKKFSWKKLKEVEKVKVVVEALARPVMRNFGDFPDRRKGK